MIAVDTNILVHAHREDSAWHQPAHAVLTELAEGANVWGIPWSCVHEFLSVVTHARIFTPPSPLKQALDQIEAWFESPTLVQLGESNAYWSVFKAAASAGKIKGPVVHDARIAALCVEHGVRELWSADRDFSRFPRVVVRNPLVDRSL